MNYINTRTNKKVITLFGKEIKIPEEWEKTIIGEHASILVGNAFESVKYSNNTKDMKLLRGDNISEGIIRWKEKTRYWSKCLKLKKYQLCENDFVISMDGSKVGKNYAYVTKRDLPCLLVQRVACIRTHLTLSQKYLGYIFGSRNFINYVNSVRTNSGIPHINIKNIQNYHFLLPQFCEQQKIASILSRVDALIETTQECIEKTQKLKNGLLQTLLKKGVNHKKFKKIKTQFNSYEVIPHEWQIKKIGDIFKFLITGTNPRVDLDNESNIKYIHYGDIHVKWNTVLDCDISNIPCINQNKIKKIDFLKEGDLIMADVSEDYEGMGASISLKNVKGRKIVSGLHTFALRNIDDQVSNDFIAYLTSFSFIKKQIIKYTTGTSVYGISKNNFKKIEILCMSLTEQQKIASILSEVDAYIQSNQQYKEKLIKLKKGLMQKLLTGQIRVKL